CVCTPRTLRATLLPYTTLFRSRAVEPTTSARTRISYAYDIRVFFHFLMENNPVYKNYAIDQFTLQDLERLEPVDIEEYQEYLKRSEEHTSQLQSRFDLVYRLLL